MLLKSIGQIRWILQKLRSPPACFEYQPEPIDTPLIRQIGSTELVPLSGLCQTETSVCSHGARRTAFLMLWGSGYSQTRRFLRDDVLIVKAMLHVYVPGY